MAGYYNPKKDYAAAIKSEKNAAKKEQLKAERQNKIDAMNAAGTNRNGYTNAIYGSPSGTSGKGNGGSYGSSGKGGYTGGSYRGSSSGNTSGSVSGGGYFDRNLDYAAAIRNEKDPVKQARLIAERQNKLNWLNGTGQNRGGWTNDIYGGGSSGWGSTSMAPALKGQYKSEAAVLNNTNKAPTPAAVQPTTQTGTEVGPTVQTSFDKNPAQMAAMQAYLTRQHANQKADDGTDNGFGYFDPNKDYAAAIKNAANTQEMVQLQRERENKLNWMNANGMNDKGYTNRIYSNYDNLFGEREPLPEYEGLTKEELMAEYNEMAERLEEQRMAMLDAALAENAAAQEKANGNFDELARQAYILKRQNESALPQQLAALGISGGGSESANLELAANYENNLASNEQARQQMLKDYSLQALQARRQADSDISGFYADAKQQALNAWQSDAANRNSWNQWAANYKQGLREYSDSMNSQTYQENLASKQYADTLRQQQIDLALQMGDYKKLAAMGYDISYLKRMQDAELEQLALDAMLTRANIAKVNSSVTRGSGGGTRGSGGGRRSSGKGDSSGNSNNNNNNNNSSDVSSLPTGNEMGDGWIMVSGMGKVGLSEVDEMLKSGTLKMVASGGKKYYMKKR